MKKSHLGHRGSKRSKQRRKVVLQLRHRIADAVHHAVCEFTDSDGYGRCLLYAVAGAHLASRVFGTLYMPAAGSLGILADPPDGWVVYDVQDAGIEGGTFHAWFNRLEHQSHGRALEVVDLSSRHFKAYANQPHITDCSKSENGFIFTFEHPEKHIGWNRFNNPPNYVWTDGAIPTDLMALRLDVETTVKMLQDVYERREELLGLHHLAWNHFRAS